MSQRQIETVITEELFPGDLLFQLRSGGEAEWVISRLFAGRDGIAINHVGLYDGDGQVIEAVMPEVRKTSMDVFIENSVRDNHGNPCLLIARVQSEYAELIPLALEFAESTLATPYDAHYGTGKKSWYCSELIIDAFRHANKGKFLFHETPMGFRDMESGELMPYWIAHYKAIDQEIPEGLPGSHPALLSRSDKIIPVNLVGALPAKETGQWFESDNGAMLA